MSQGVKDDNRDTATGETVYRATRVSGYGSLAFSPDGRRFLIPCPTMHATAPSGNRAFRPRWRRPAFGRRR